MGIAFVTPNSKLPGLNFEAPPGIRDLEFLFDQVFAGEQRNRMQLVMGHYRDNGASYGIVDQQNPNSALPGLDRPLCVKPNAGNPLTIDIFPGAAVTKAGNVIIVPENLTGLKLANEALTTNAPSSIPVSPQFQGVENVVLLEYVVIDQPETNVVTNYNTVEAVRRDVALPIDPNAESTSSTSPDLNKSQLVKVVTIQDFLDLSKFSEQRLNDVVVLAIVKVVSNSSPPPSTILSIDMSNAINTFVRPWFSSVDQEHRAMIGTGSPDVPHSLGYNDLSGGALTLYQQLLQRGSIISRDINVPGCPGKLCSELIDNARVFTDGDGSITGTTGQRYVRLNSYPNRIIGSRANKLDGLTVVEDKSITAACVAVELIPNTNILLLGRQGSVNEIYDSSLGFTVYYTDTDCLRPPALPHDVMLVANDIIQFQKPSAIEEYVTGGKIYNELPTTDYPVGTNGPVPKNYDLVLDKSQQFVECPQVVVCARLINGANGVGTAVNEPQFPMYGPARIRAALYNATPQPNATLEVQVELAGKDINGAIVTETLIFHGTAGSAQPAQVAWDQPLTLPASGEFPDIFQISNTVFSSLDTWKIKQTPINAGANALIQLWAEIEPTTTPDLDDALPICQFNWNGQAVARIRDTRPIEREIKDPNVVTVEQAASHLMTWNTSIMFTPLLGESFKDPRYQDNVLSKRNRHNSALNTCFSNEAIAAFNSDGTHPGREWYYSQAIVLPQITGTDVLYVTLFGANSLFSTLGSFGGDVLIQYQVSTVSNPDVFGSWNTMFPIAAGGSRIWGVGVTNNFKVRLRIAGKNLSGFIMSIKTV